MADGGIDLERELDRIYGLPLGEFVAARNELAKRLRQVGDKQDADGIKKLPKPSLTAWAVNQLAFRAGAELAGLRAAGEAVKAAHLAGREQQQAAAKARRDAVSTLRLVAEVALQEAGTSPTRDHRRRIVQTLEALSSQGSEESAPRAGRLSADLEPAGFDALSDLAAALAAAQAARPRVKKKEPAAPKPAPNPAAPKPPKVVEHPASKPPADREAERAAADRAAKRRQLDRRRTEARARLEQLEERLGTLSAAAEEAASGLDAAKDAEAGLAAAAAEAERLARQASKRAEEAGAETARARRGAESASAARQRAEAEIGTARREVERLDDAIRELDG